MKKRFVKICAALALCSFTAGNTTAQTNTRSKKKNDITLYYKFGLGYAFANGGMVSNFNGSLNDKAEDMLIFNFKPASFSAGVNAHVSGGLLFNKHMGVELGLQSGVANKAYTYVEEGRTVLSTGTEMEYTATYTSQARGVLLVSPSVVMQTGGEKVNGYTRLGIAIPLSNKIYLDATRTAPGFSDVYINGETTMRMALGVTGAVGAYFKIGKSINMYAEANMLSLSPKLKESEITSYIVNNRQYVSSLTVRDKRTLYEYSATANTASTSTNIPRVTVTEAMPYSNVGVMVGMLFHL